jgi:hypothetical protein
MMTNAHRHIPASVQGQANAKVLKYDSIRVRSRAQAWGVSVRRCLCRYELQEVPDSPAAAASAAAPHRSSAELKRKQVCVGWGGWGWGGGGQRGLCHHLFCPQVPVPHALPPPARMNSAQHAYRSPSAALTPLHPQQTPPPIPTSTPSKRPFPHAHPSPPPTPTPPHPSPHCRAA